MAPKAAKGAKPEPAPAPPPPGAKPEEDKKDALPFIDTYPSSCGPFLTSSTT
ncbi:CKLF like MARVEL transmembrane domain containing 2 [Homo sapiens]|uniref:CKLF like MARVEL transmembrane domain containing 2 n=1 Tax=Homo sapiens TaxID=9606 RepID=H3BMC0_HUMAN|nr:CKLF like MARVEL transmembrane domain containing 2 [Homo sapiens]KAI4055370.1 CKLF like MARVEL transmembrane domain containing 2 [Homo sapiens]